MVKEKRPAPPSTRHRTGSTRRGWMKAVSIASSATWAGCAFESSDDGELWPDLETPWEDESLGNDALYERRLDVEAALEVLLPPEVDELGDIVGPGAVEVRAFEVLAGRRFVPALQDRGLLPRWSGVTVDLEPEGAVTTALALDLARAAARTMPGSAFRNLPPGPQEIALRDGLADPTRQWLYESARAACFVAYLGAVHTDEGLQRIGFPPYVDFRQRIANEGYPRRIDGTALTLGSPEIARLLATGQLDHYSHERAPQPTPGDDLALVLDPDGELY